MKNTLYILSALALASLLAFACNKAETSESDVVTVNYTVTAPVTKAFGEGESINTIWYALYKIDGTLVTDFGTVAFNAGSAVCPVTMVRDQSYKVVFVGLHYDGQNPVYAIDPAKAAIAMPATAVANTDKYELFCTVQEVIEYDGGKTGSARLDRIVSQVNFVCTTEDWNAAATLGMTPAQSAVTLGGVPASYDILAGAVSSATLSVDYQRAALSGVTNLLGAAYCLAGSNVSATLKLYPSETATEPSTILEVPVVPVEANKRTNITGSIMTGTLNYTIGLETTSTSTDKEI